MDAFHALRVRAIERLTADAVAVTFELPDPLRELYAFRAGQHLTLRRGDARRTYSLCSAVGGPLRIGVKRVPAGAFSTWIHEELQVGDSLDVAPPSGRFGPDPTCLPRRVGLVAAGSGITPVLSIAATVLTDPDTQVVLVYGNRSSADVMFLDELADLKDRHPERLQLVHVLSREPQLSPLLSGRLDHERLTALLPLVAPEFRHWWCCGPRGVVESARTALRSLGIDDHDIHAELFFAGPALPPPVDADEVGATLTATLNGRTSVLSLLPGQLLLDAVLATRGDAPYACRGGVCGTCRARVVEGHVRMATNWALEPDEVAAGLVLTCQARATTPAVTVDFG